MRILLIFLPVVFIKRLWAGTLACVYHRLRVEGQGFRSGSTCSQSGWERIHCYSILVPVRRSFFRASPPDPQPFILPVSGSPGVDSTMRCISQAGVQTWANINVSPVGKSSMPDGDVSIPLNLYSECISRGSSHVEGQGFRFGSNCSQSGWERTHWHSIYSFRFGDRSSGLLGPNTDVCTRFPPSKLVHRSAVYKC